MTTRQANVHRIFLLAAELPAAERDACLREQCGSDEALRAEVATLLRHADDASFLGEARLADVRAALHDDEAPPARIGAFRVLGMLGRGGMGVVYRAQQDQPSREVALKVLAPGTGAPAARTRFALEAEALGRLQHPGIAQILAAGTYPTAHGERPFLAMELVRGAPLHHWAREHAPSLARRIAAWVELCDAVHHAHQKGVVHRDLKPGNVLVDEQGRVKVLDFGIARLVDTARTETLHTLAGQLLGTLTYMSPEQANGAHERIDVRSDVYSLGAIGYELLSGEPPLALDGAALTLVLRRIVEQEPIPLGQRDRRLRGDLQTIAAKALSKDPERRYASAEALANDLRRHLAHEPILARPATAGYVVRRFARRHRGLVVGAALALLATIGGAGASIVWAVRAGRAEAAAQEEARLANRVTELLRGLFLGASPETGAGRNPTAKEILAAGMSTIDRERAADPLGASRVSLILGEVFVALGDLASGERYIQSALDALRAAFAGDDERVVEALHVRAWSLVRAGRFADAGPLFAEALAMHERLGRPSDVTIAKCVEGLATVAARAGDTEGALALLARARPLRERANDPLRLAVHWQTVATTSLLGKRFADADAAFASARAALPSSGGEPFAAVIATNLGNLRLRQQRFDDAEAEFRTALALGERVFGKDSPRLVHALSHVGTICARSGRTEEAEALLRRALTVGGDDTTSGDGALADALCNLGKLCGMQGRPEEAVALWTRAEAMERRVRPGAVTHLRLLDDLAAARQELGDDAGAAAARALAEQMRAQEPKDARQAK